jgi:hypothetical protein
MCVLSFSRIGRLKGAALSVSSSLGVLLTVNEQDIT